MDKLVADLLSLLREMLAGQQRLLQFALARREAMRTLDVERLQSMNDQERAEAQAVQLLDKRRQALVAQFKTLLGRNVDATVTEIARRVPEPTKSQLLGLAAQLKAVMEQVERNNRINATVSETVVTGLARVLKAVTGLAQHAGMYMRNGRKAALHGIHLLEITA
jgi:seryl-tRNA synthetase